jgi:hypothetical protein
VEIPDKQVTSPSDWLRRLQVGVGTSLMLAVLLSLNALFNFWQHTTGSSGIDFFVLWSIPHVRKTKAVSNIYAFDSQRDMASVLITESSSPQVSQAQREATAINMQLNDNRVAVTGSPLVYALVGLTASGAYEKDLSRFRVASWLCFLGAMLILCRLVQFSPVSTLLAVALFTSSFQPLLADMWVANLNQIQLLSLACFLLFVTLSWEVLAGLALGIGVMLKPNIVIVAFLSILVSLADREYRRMTRLLLGMCLAALLSVAISVSYFGRPAIWPDFIQSLPRTLATSAPMENGNIGLAVLLFRTMHWEMSMYILVILMATVSILIFKARWDRVGKLAAPPSHGADESTRSMHRMFVVVGLGCAVMLMSSRLVWPHYYVLLIPLELYLLRPLGWGDRPQRRLVVSILAGIGFCLLSRAMWHAMANMLQGSIAVNAAAALIFILALCETWWQAEPDQDKVIGAARS